MLFSLPEMIAVETT